MLIILLLVFVPISNGEETAIRGIRQLLLFATLNAKRTSPNCDAAHIVSSRLQGVVVGIQGDNETYTTQNWNQAYSKRVLGTAQDNRARGPLPRIRKVGGNIRLVKNDCMLEAYSLALIRRCGDEKKRA